MRLTTTKSFCVIRLGLKRTMRLIRQNENASRRNPGIISRIDPIPACVAFQIAAARIHAAVGLGGHVMAYAALVVA